MKILYDGQIFDSQKFGGISRYFYELMSSFNDGKGIEYSLPIKYSDNVYLKQLEPIGDSLTPIPMRKNFYQDFLGGKSFRFKNRLYEIKKKFLPEPIQIDAQKENRMLSIAKIKEGDFDLFHPTYYDDYFLEHIGNKPFVLTVYDLIHQIFPEFLIYEKHDKNQELLQRAAKIIAISESTKKDLVSLFNVEENNVIVTYLANSLNGDSSLVSNDFKKEVPANYILFVGTRGGYKNFLFFAQVMSVLFKKEPDLYVVCTGAAFNDAEIFFFEKLGFKNRFLSFFVNDDQLTYLYTHATAFIFPSQYEGFGLPVLESMSCGCLALVSQSSSLTEVGGEASIYFDPKDPASMLTAIKTALYDDEVRHRKIAEGYGQVKKFSWDRLSAETKEVYKTVLAKN